MHYELEEDDYTICDYGSLGGQYIVNPCGAIFNHFEEVEEFILEDMNANNYWPNIWLVSDHGNLTLLCYNKAGELVQAD